MDVAIALLPQNILKEEWFWQKNYLNLNNHNHEFRTNNKRFRATRRSS
jgi:hypothetical protein